MSIKNEIVFMSPIIKRPKGFTLIELLVVIAIIGLLSTLATVSLDRARIKSRDAARVADIKQVQTALEMYYSDYNSYPSFGGNPSTLGVGAATTVASGTKVYMAKLPKDPALNVYTYNGRTAAGALATFPNAVSYTLEYKLEGGVENVNAGSPHVNGGKGIATATPGGLSN